MRGGRQTAQPSLRTFAARTAGGGGGGPVGGHRGPRYPCSCLPAGVVAAGGSGGGGACGGVDGDGGRKGAGAATAGGDVPVGSPHSPPRLRRGRRQRRWRGGRPSQPPSILLWSRLLGAPSARPAAGSAAPSSCSRARQPSAVTRHLAAIRARPSVKRPTRSTRRSRTMRPSLNADTGATGRDLLVGSRAALPLPAHGHWRGRRCGYPVGGCQYGHVGMLCGLPGPGSRRGPDCGVRGRAGGRGFSGEPSWGGCCRWRSTVAKPSRENQSGRRWR